MVDWLPVERISSNIGAPVDCADLGSLAGGRLPIMETLAVCATANRTVRIEYAGEKGVSTRSIEPYALRRSKEGRVYLLAVDPARGGEARTFRFDRIRAAQPEGGSFTPRYAVEFPAPATGGGVRDPAAPRTGGRGAREPLGVVLDRVAQSVVMPGDYHPRSRRGADFTVVCPFCGVRFTADTYRTALAPHKAESGERCEGRHGFPI